MQVIRNKKIKCRCFGNAAIAFAVLLHTWIATPKAKKELKWPDC